MGVFSFLKPAKFIERTTKDVDKSYTRYRIQLFLSAYIGYMGYYFVRSTLSLAKPHLISKVGLSISQVGYLGSALAVAYGFSKFLMGNVSDRSNPRYFLAIGLIISAIANLLVPQSSANYYLLFSLMFLNGWAQGMGWPACGRIMTHWFSDSERGTKMAFWNTAHNVGAGLLPLLTICGIFLFSSWSGSFYFPAIISIFIAVLVLIFGRDTPQSVGLPPIEEYRNDYPLEDVERDLQNREEEMTSKQILFSYVLSNKYVWLFALANVFVYCVRYGILNWSPTYLTEVKHFNITDSNIGFSTFELCAIPGTILMGWLSDKYFSGRRSPLCLITMVLIMFGIVVYWQATTPLISILALGFIGFLIYGPVMLIGVAALDLVPKKAAGTSAGFTGLFGYFFGTMGAEALTGYLVQNFGWNSGFILLLGSCVISILLFMLTWNVHNKNATPSHTMV